MFCNSAKKKKIQEYVKFWINYFFSGSLKTLVKGVSSASSQSRLPRWLAGNGNQWETQRKVGNKKTMGSHRFQILFEMQILETEALAKDSLHTQINIWKQIQIDFTRLACEQMQKRHCRLRFRRQALVTSITCKSIGY